MLFRSEIDLGSPKLKIYDNKNSDVVVLAYNELTSFAGVKEDKKEFINQVYKEIFNEDVEFGFPSVVTIQARKLKYHIENNLNIKL